MSDKLDRDWFITEIAHRAHFSKKDIEIVLNTIIDILTEAVRDNATIKVRSFFKLYNSKLPPRKGKGGISLPEATRSIFRLSENIRYAQRDERNSMS